MRLPNIVLELKASLLQRKGGRTWGKQIYLGGFDTEQAAARAYDIASLKFWGSGTETNVSNLAVPCHPKQKGGDSFHSLQLAAC